MSTTEISNLTPEMEKKRKKRRRVAQELLETEVSYVANLEILKESFYDPLNENSKTNDKVISADDVRTIFGSLNIILPVNKMLLAELQKRLQVPETNYLEIGDAFQTLAYCLKSYTAYCNDFDNARKILTKLKKNSSFLEFFNKISSNSNLKGKTIFDFMILPVQRIPRYRMLLMEIYKNTWESHPDYNSLSEACKNINETAQSVENSQEKHANINKIIALQQDLKIPKKLEKEIGSLLQADRKLSLEGVFQCSENDSSTSSRKLLLFNDILLITKVSMEKQKEDKKKKREIMQVKKVIHLNTVTNIIKSGSIEQQPALSIYYGNSQYNLHIENQKDTDSWNATLVKCRTYAIQKKKMNDRSVKNSPTINGDNTNKKGGWPTLKRRKTGSNTLPIPKDEKVVDNPLFGVRVKLNSRTSLLRNEEDMVKKSPSMNAMVDPTKNETNGDPKKQKRKLFSRSTSVDALHKISQGRKPSKSSTSGLNDE